MNNSKEVNSWLILLMVLVTALITTWAMLKYKPTEDWNASSYYPPQQVAQNLSPGIAAMQEGWQSLQGSWQFAAAAAPTPVICAGAVAMHTDRGVCTGCHTVVGSRRQAIAPVGAYSNMPHEFRGVCSNCHLHLNPSGLNANPYGTQAATPVAAVRPVVAPPTMAPVKTATEGEWLGLEVTPITPLTARQYGIRDGMRGLVVAEAESLAAMVGVRAGDLLVSVNGAPITDMTDFFQATRNGTLPEGVVEVVRQGQRLTIELAQTSTPAVAAAPNPPINAFPAGPRAAMPVRQGNYMMPPANADAWGGGQGMGVAAGAYPGACLQRQF